MASATKAFQSLWEGLNSRQKEIIVGRFGLDKFDEPQTLAALGNRYGITRERVRQIEAHTSQILKKKIAGNPLLLDILERTKKFVKTSGGLAKEENLLAHQRSFADGLTEPQLTLLLTVSGMFEYHPEDQHTWPFYFIDKANIKTALHTVDQFVKFLKSRKDEILTGRFDEQFKAFVKKEGVAPAHLENYLQVSKKVATNPYGDTGLVEWPEIKPTTIRDRIYLILKKTGKPLHFETIAKTINEVGFGSRPALVPTVHNELIKDARFVLVGRGIYGLTEHGYEPGTAKEVIGRVLRKNGALKPQEIILAVQRERFFRPNTVLANLQNKDMFRRLADGSYQVRES